MLFIELIDLLNTRLKFNSQLMNTLKLQIIPNNKDLEMHRSATVLNFANTK